MVVLSLLLQLCVEEHIESRWLAVLIFLIISSAIGLWASHFDHFPDLYGTEYEYVVGFALARWELRPSTDPPPNTDYEFMQGIASGLSRSMYNVRGFIQYPVLEVAKLSVQHAVQSHVDYSANAGELDLLLRVLSDFPINLPDGSVYSVRGLLNRWQRVHQPSPVVSVKLAPPFASKVVNSEWSLLHIVSICSRLCRSQLLVRTEPGDRKLSNWLSTLPSSCSYNSRCAAGTLKHKYDWLAVFSRSISRY